VHRFSSRKPEDGARAEPVLLAGISDSLDEQPHHDRVGGMAYRVLCRRRAVQRYRHIVAKSGPTVMLSPGSELTSYSYVETDIGPQR
jgi:hypothetical protein